MVSVVLVTTVVWFNPTAQGTVTYIYQTKNYTEAEHLFCFFFSVGRKKFR